MGYTAHVGYFVPLTKIADFLRAGVEVCLSSGHIKERITKTSLSKVTVLLAGMCDIDSDLLGSLIDYLELRRARIPR